MRHWNIYIVEQKTYQPRILCPTKLSFEYEGEIYIHRENLRKFVVSRLVLQEMLQEAPYKGKCLKYYSSETHIYVKKNIKDGINEDEMKTCFSYIYLTELITVCSK